jgi:hypothetical protein
VRARHKRKRRWPRDTFGVINANMNRLIVASARRGERPLLTPFPGRGESSTVLRERLSGALDDLERAKRSGNEDAIDFCDFRVEQMVKDARAARTSAQPQSPPVNFDGGVRGRKSPPAPGSTPLTANALFAQAVTQSRVERAARDAEEQTIIVNSI